MSSRTLAVCAVAMLLSVAAASLDVGSVCAQSSDADEARDQRARRHFDSATAFFETGDYESAVRGFRAAYAESSRADLLYNVFLCEERLGNLSAAVEALERYLADGEPANRATLEQRLLHLRERSARGETRIAADDRGSDEVGPTSGGTEPSAGSGASDAGDAASGDAASGGNPSALPIVGFTLAGVGLVSFAVAGGITLAEDSALADCTPMCSDERLNAIGTASLVADISAGVALVGAVIGVIGLIVDANAPRGERASVRLRGLGLEGGF